MLRQATTARVALGRSGDAVPTSARLNFMLAHAKARDAVHSRFDHVRLRESLRGYAHYNVCSMASDRATFIRRPDLGRRLSPESEDLLRNQLGGESWDLVFVLGDGLSAAAGMAHAAGVLKACYDRLAGWKIAPVIVADGARVALADDIGEAIGARMSVILIGERPGLTAADSLGMYLTWDPRRGRSDAQRNCISNIHDGGLGYDAAATKAAWLITQAGRLKLTGVRLKENSPSETEGLLPGEVLSLPGSRLARGSEAGRESGAEHAVAPGNGPG